MAFYLFLSERHGTGVGSRWAFMGLAVKLGISVSGTTTRLPRCHHINQTSFIDGPAYVSPQLGAIP